MALALWVGKRGQDVLQIGKWIEADQAHDDGGRTDPHAAIQRRSKFALSPCSSAIAATDTPIP